MPIDCPLAGAAGAVEDAGVSDFFSEVQAAIATGKLLATKLTPTQLRKVRRFIVDISQRFF